MEVLERVFESVYSSQPTENLLVEATKFVSTMNEFDPINFIQFLFGILLESYCSFFPFFNVLFLKFDLYELLRELLLNEFQVSDTCFVFVELLKLQYFFVKKEKIREILISSIQRLFEEPIWNMFNNELEKLLYRFDILPKSVFI